MDLLRIEDLHVYYGNIAAVKSLSMRVKQGEIVAVIGANGAGKSTTLRTISGLIRPRRGSMMFRGEELAGRPAHEVVARGISHSPEGRRLFSGMTVRENLELGAFLRTDSSSIIADVKDVYGLFPQLRKRSRQKAGTLSGGEQQMLAVGRALMRRPTLLLLDEPSMGLAPKLVDVVFKAIEAIRAGGTTVLLVEQNAIAALRIADYAYVMESGQLRLQGEARVVIQDRRVQNAYLGA